MGIMPDETEYGDDCAECYLSGKTPLRFKLFLSGIQKSSFWAAWAGPPPNGYYDILQHDVDHCRWYKDPWVAPSGWYMHHPGHSHVHWDSIGGAAAFVSESSGPCAYQFDNQIPAGPGALFEGGFCTIAVAGTVSGGESSPFVNLAAVINSVTPMFDPDPRMECFPLDEDHTIIRYAGKRRHKSLF